MYKSPFFNLHPLFLFFLIVSFPPTTSDLSVVIITSDYSDILLVFSSDGAQDDDDDRHIDEDQNDREDFHLSEVYDRYMAIGHLSPLKSNLQDICDL